MQSCTLLALLAKPLLRTIIGNYGRRAPKSADSFGLRVISARSARYIYPETLDHLLAGWFKILRRCGWQRLTPAADDRLVN
jgi:hypothetical protein